MPKPIASTFMPARYVAVLCDVLRARGSDVGPLLKAAGIPAALLSDPGAALALHQLEALISKLPRSVKGGAIAFEFGRRIKLSSHEVLGYGLLTSSTLDDALQLLARYYRLITPAFKLQYRRDRGMTELRLVPALELSHEALVFLLETIVVSAHELLSELTQSKVPPCDVYVSYDEPAHASAYRALKPARFHFSAEQLPIARLTLDSRTAALKLPLADRAALQRAELRCRQLLSRTAEAGRLTEWVEMMLRESYEGLPTLAELSHLINQPLRTMDRHLAREGSRFLAISKRIRHEKARALLEAENQSITQIAYELGYRDSANFTRAFRRESGLSPSDHRRKSHARRRRNM